MSNQFTVDGWRWLRDNHALSKELAVEFVHRYGRYFAGGPCWLNSGEKAGMLAEVARCRGGPGVRIRRAPSRSRVYC